MLLLRASASIRGVAGRGVATPCSRPAPVFPWSQPPLAAWRARAPPPSFIMKRGAGTTDVSCDASGSHTNVTVSSSFDSGNIEVVDDSNPCDIELSIRPDPFCEKDGRAHFQWYHFRATGLEEAAPITFRLLGADKASYAPAWNGYNSCASYDRKHWFRVPTAYDESTGVLTISHTPERSACFYAYFAPYSMERHHDLVAGLVAAGVKHEQIGSTVDGQAIDLLQIGEPGDGKRVVWVTCRQHPGESMAEWWAEGFLARLTDKHDAVGRKLQSKAVFYVVPNSNPDGARRGHLRCNAAGANLNREWMEPSLEYSPEVFYIRREMHARGCDLYLDVHGDEELPYNFVTTAKGVPTWGARLEGLEGAFKAAYCRASPDFQTVYGYPDGPADLRIASLYVAAHFDCLALTLEQPFKDTADTPFPEQGWCPERAVKFGAAALDPIDEVLPILRD